MKVRRLRRLGITCLSAGVLSAGMLFGADSAATRLKETALVLREIMGTPDKAIPKELLRVPAAS